MVTKAEQNRFDFHVQRVKDIGGTVRLAGWQVHWFTPEGELVGIMRKHGAVNWSLEIVGQDGKWCETKDRIGKRIADFIVKDA